MAFRGTAWSSGGGGGLGFGFGMTPWVKKLLIANGAVFLLTAFIYPRAVLWFAFVPSDVLFRPWTLVTYMFVHGGFWHLLFNMIGLFFFGPPLEGAWGSREFIKFYIICGLGGAALSFIFAFDAGVVGASAAVFGVMFAFAMNWPNSPIYIWGIFPIKAKWLIAIMVAFTLYSAVGGAGDGVAHFAHLGGFAAAFVYLRFSDRLAMATNRAGGRLARIKRKLAKLGGPRLVVVSDDESSGADEPPARREEEERLLDEVDRVLDKISTSGISSLTAEERKLLDRVSQRYRQN